MNWNDKLFFLRNQMTSLGWNKFILKLQAPGPQALVMGPEESCHPLRKDSSCRDAPLREQKHCHSELQGQVSKKGHDTLWREKPTKRPAGNVSSHADPESTSDGQIGALFKEPDKRSMANAKCWSDLLDQFRRWTDSTRGLSSSKLPSPNSHL